MISHAVGFLLSLFIIYVASPGSDLFSWHPTCMALAFLFVAVEGVLLFSPESVMHVPNLRPWKVTFHWMAMGLTVALTFSGFGAIYYNKESMGRPHFMSWHSWVGLATVGLTGMQSVAGWSIKLGAFGPKSIGDMKFNHGMGGCITTMLGMTAIILGMQSLWFSQKVAGHLWTISVGAVGFLILVIANHMLKTTIKRKPKPKAAA